MFFANFLISIAREHNEPSYEDYYFSSNSEKKSKDLKALKTEQSYELSSYNSSSRTVEAAKPRHGSV